MRKLRCTSSNCFKELYRGDEQRQRKRKLNGEELLHGSVVWEKGLGISSDKKVKTTERETK